MLRYNRPSTHKFVPRFGTIAGALAAMLVLSAAPAVADDDSESTPRMHRTADGQHAEVLPYDSPLAYTLFGRPGRFIAKANIKPRFRKDFSLGEVDDDEWKLSTRLDLRTEYDPADWIKTMLGFRYIQNSDLAVEDNETESDGNFQRGLAWIYFYDVASSGFGLQVGRQKFRDDREWWWDERLDAVRVEWMNEKLLFEFAVAEDLFKVSLDEDHMDAEIQDVRRLLGHADWTWSDPHHLELYFLNQNDHSDKSITGQLLAAQNEDEVDADLTWIGLRSTGKYKINTYNRLYYWLDTAFVWGDETTIDFDPVAGQPGLIRTDDIFKQDVEGWAFDIGTTWDIRLGWEPRVTVGFAMGSGDSDPRQDAPGTSSSFRQTGLNDNNGKWRGENRFRYYGELLRPELSNLEVTTFGVGFPLLEDSSIELVHHYYRQVHEAEFLRKGRIRTQPLGDDPDIGHEFDLALGIEEWEYLDIEFIAAMFRAGDAYGSNEGELAYNVSIAFKLEI